jgi:hypothetical protein
MTVRVPIPHKSKLVPPYLKYCRWNSNGRETYPKWTFSGEFFHRIIDILG